MYKKILLSIACNIYSFNHCFFQDTVTGIHSLLKTRADYASRLDSDINTFIANVFSPKAEKIRPPKEVISLAEFPGKVPEEVQQMIRALINPKAHTCSQGYIFYGDPGTGKNTLINIIAKETKAHLLEQSASEFINTYIGKGAAEIRQLFVRARELSRDAPVVIFIDEIDSIGCRGNVDNSEMALTFNQLLNSMNQVQAYHPIVVIGATNCEDRLDGALCRAGRFELVHIKLPNEKERFNILSYYARTYNCALDANFYQKIAEETDGFCCASLEEIFKQAKSLAKKYDIPLIAKNHINQALDRERVLHLKNQEIKKNNRERAHDAVQAKHLSHAESQLSLSTFNTVLAAVTFVTYLFI